ncbi:MAG: fumarylacetoacetate hydrolase family protein [Clostridiales bacterium]|nr:fumarylacetoacetate hydrolase family protein [Clostridiales bacterium]
MRFVNYIYNMKQSIGIIKNNKIIPLEHILNRPVESMMTVIDEISIELIESNLNKEVQGINLEDVKILAPIEFPRRNLFCLGKNYKAHALEMKGKTTDQVVIPDKPIYFSKACHKAIGQGDVITGHVGVSEQVDYEVELAVIIGKEGSHIKKEDVYDHIFGYTICNDVSARDLQVEHIQWHRGKSLDGFCPLGPVIIHKSVVNFPPDLKIECYINDELRQEGRTSDLIFDIETIVSDLSRGMTLLPGDIILTGTPSGVGMGFKPPKYLKSEDIITCIIESIGELKNIIK